MLLLTQSLWNRADGCISRVLPQACRGSKCRLVSKRVLGGLVEYHCFTALFITWHASWSPSWSRSALCWQQQWRCKPHSTGTMAMQATRANKISLMSAATSFSPYRSEHSHVCMFSKEKLKCPPCTDLYGPAEEYLSPSLHSNSLPRISVLWSDISITVTISPSDWSPLASKLGYFPALRWRKHFVGSIINLTTKLWLVLSQVIKQSHGRKMTQFKGCS